jgi:hypothetical protein
MGAFTTQIVLIDLQNADRISERRVKSCSPKGKTLAKKKEEKRKETANTYGDVLDLPHGLFQCSRRVDERHVRNVGNLSS